MIDKLKKQIQSEIRFLQSKEMKWLIHETDIGSCHEDYKPIIKRINRLKKKLLIVVY